MKLRKYFNIFMATATTLAVVACHKDDPGKDDPAKDDYPEIGSIAEYHGTKIDSKVNAIGWVCDASTKKGIAGVPVTDGFDFVLTDANGVYQITGDKNYCRKIHITLPAEYEVPLDEENHLPLFFSTKDFKGKKLNVNDFTLTPLKSPETNWTFVGIGDPQCQTEDEGQRYINETIPDIVSELSSAQTSVYCMTLGDLTHDSTNMWPTMTKSMSNVKFKGSYLPFFQTIGNHDHNSQTSTAFASTGEFVKHFGPEDYSFNRGKVHIISMDDVRVTAVKSNSSPNKATWEYNAGFTESQWEWFKKDIANVKDKGNKMVLLCMHIPMRKGSGSGGSNFNTDKRYQDVLNELRQFHEAHIIIGHTHYPQNYIHSITAKGGKKIYEHIHQAACGAWWCSNSSVTGGPNGYTVYTIEGNEITDWYMKGTGRQKDYQMRAYDGNQIYNGSKGFALNWYSSGQKAGSGNIAVTVPSAQLLKGKLIVEVWDDDASFWKLELYNNGEKVGNLTRIADGTTCNVAIVSYYFNEKGKNTDTWTNKTASHYWYISTDVSKLGTWYVKATQEIPGGKTHEYIVANITRDYNEF